MKQTMTNLLLVLTLGFCQLTIKAQVTKEKVTESLYKAIASDPLYDDFQQVILKSASNNMNGVYDLKSIHAFWVEHDGSESFCNLDISKSAIKGLKEYKEIQCELDEKRAKLTEKYAQFSDFDKAAFSKINKEYRLIHPFDVNELTTIKTNN